MRSRNGNRSSLEYSRTQPAYVQITDYLRDLLPKIQGRLPTEAELSKTFQVSRQTARRAYAQLVADGLVERAPGKGSFAAHAQRLLTNRGSIEDVTEPSQDRELEVITPLGLVKNVAAATKLGLIDDIVGFVSCRYLYERNIFGLGRVYLPPNVAASLADVEFLHKEGGVAREFVIGILNRRLAHPIAIAKQLISAVAASPEIAAAIQCVPGQPLLKIEFLYFDTEARPVQLNVNYYNPDLYEYRSQLQRRPDSASTMWGAIIGSRMADKGVINE